jgi:AraC-like DNA-binding protein
VIYREFDAAPALRPFVERLWWLEGPAETIAAEPIPPDGRTEIIVHGGDPFAQLDETGQARVQDRVLFAGQLTRAVRLRPRGHARVVGAHLRPHAAHALFGVPQRDVTDSIVDLRNVHRGLARRLRDDAAGRESGEEMIAALAGALEAQAEAAQTRIAGATAVAVAIATGRKGLVQVADLAGALGLSARQVERLFDERVGLSPKFFLRVVRFQEVLRGIRQETNATTWAARAAEHGFYDQAHFIRDFKMFVGESPGAWHVGDESLAAVFSALRRDSASLDGLG